MDARWHATPSPSKWLLVLPLSGIPLGIGWALAFRANPADIPTAHSAHMVLFHLAAPTITLGVVTLGIFIRRRTSALQPRALRRRFLKASGWIPVPANSPMHPRAVRRRLPFVLPGRAHATVADAAVTLGSDARGRAVMFTCDESMLVIGPPGSGKDRRVAMPLLSQWPGFALVTSTKTDLLEGTRHHRIHHGPVAVFNPAQFPLRFTDELTWNPITGCQMKDVAARRAAALIAGGLPSLTEKFWATAATRILRATLHAAALTHGSVLEACEMATSVTGWLYAAGRLAALGETTWHAQLREDASLDPRTSSSIVATLAGTLIGIQHSTLSQYLTPTDRSLDLTEFLQHAGTIYALAPAEPDSHLVYRPWTTLLASEVAACLRELAAGSRLVPPALLLLNEVVHVCPLPELPGLLADGRGHNIATVAIVQDPAQLATRYSPDEARAIMAAAQHRLLLSAGSHETAKEWSDLIGSTRVRTRTHTKRGLGMRADSTSTGDEQTPVMAAAELRHLPYGCGVFLPRGAPAMPLHLAELAAISRKASTE